MQIQNARIKFGNLIPLFCQQDPVLEIHTPNRTLVFWGRIDDYERKVNSGKIPDLTDKYVSDIGTSFRSNNSLSIWLKHNLDEKDGPTDKPPYIMDDFPKRELLLVDILHYVDGKEELFIVDESNGNFNIQYEGRAEYLCYTGEGCMDELGTRKVSWYESGIRDGRPCLNVYLDEE